MECDNGGTSDVAGFAGHVCAGAWRSCNINISRACRGASNSNANMVPNISVALLCTSPSESRSTMYSVCNLMGIN